ncbi:MAG: polysaccharide deacetylase family protein [Candidatus Nitrosotenuis sp.]
MIGRICLGLIVVCFFAIPAYAQEETGTLEILVKSESGDRVSPDALGIKIFQGLQTTPLKVIAPLENNPDVSQLPLGHRYKVEVYMNNLYAGVGFIDLGKSKEQLDITIKNAGGMRLGIYYKDGQTPIQNAMVWIKSQDGKSWFYSETDKNGQTGRMWLYPSIKEDNYYYADVSLGQNLVYTHSPIKLQPNIAQEFKVVTSWPAIIDKMFTVEVYNTTTSKVAKQDGSFVAQIYDIKKNKIAESPVTDKGLAHFTNLKVGNYALYIKEKGDLNLLKTIAGKKLTMTESVDKIKIYLYNPELNDDHLNCNCVAFRLDDVQDFFLSPAQQAIISTFKDKNAPLTLGVIGGVTGTEQKLVSTIRGGLTEDEIEIANHSWRHNVYTKMTKADQAADIKKTNDKISEVFGVRPTTFIPPENLFNNDTISVLKENGFTHMSPGETGVVDAPPKFKKSDFYQFPMLAYTAKLDINTGFWNHETNEQILEKINDSIFNYGYAVVMMHPHEFSLYENGVYVNKVNNTKIAELGMLLDRVRAENLQILTIGSIQDYGVPKAAKPVEQKTLEKNCNCIAFRLDNIQDFWLNDVQGTLIETFDKNEVPLTMSVIGKFIGNDPKTVDLIKQKLDSNPASTRLANRGWEYVDHTSYDKQRQASSIKQTNDKISKVFGVRAVIFAPPFDSFNQDTVAAAADNKILYFSSNIAKEKSATLETLRHVPSTETFGNLVDDDPFLGGTISQKAMQKINSNIAQYGFAVISMQPSDFAIKDGELKNEIDTSRLDLLESVIRDAKSAGINTVLLERVPTLLDESVIVVPDWVKDNARWWAEGKIGDSDFTKGLEYLIEQHIIKIPATEKGTSKATMPGWIKANAGWWADGKIGTSDFVRGIQYLIQNGIIRV